MKRKREGYPSQTENEGERSKKVPKLNNMSVRRNDFRSRIIGYLSEGTLKNLYNYGAQSEKRGKIRSKMVDYKKTYYITSTDKTIKFIERELRVYLLDLQHLIIPDTEPKENVWRSKIKSSIRGITSQNLQELVEKNWDLSRVSDKPDTRVEQCEWVYDVLFDRIPDTQKREIEGENIKQMDFEDMRFFSMCGQVVPDDVMKIIFDFLPRKKEIMNSFGVLNERFYVFTLMNWGEINVNLKTLFKIPQLVIENAKTVILSFKNTLTFKSKRGRKANEYLCDRIKNARKIIIRGKSIRIILKEFPTVKSVEIDIPCISTMYPHYNIHLGEISMVIKKYYPETNNLRIISTHDILINSFAGDEILELRKKLCSLTLKSKAGPYRYKFFQIPPNFERCLNLTKFFYVTEAPGYLNAKSFKILSKLKLVEYGIPFSLKFNKGEEVKSFVNSQTNVRRASIVFFTNLVVLNKKDEDVDKKWKGKSFFLGDSIKWFRSLLVSPKLERLEITYLRVTKKDIEDNMELLNDYNPGIREFIIRISSQDFSFKMKMWKRKELQHDVYIPRNET